MSGGGVDGAADGQRSGRDDEREEAFLAALLQGDFAAARNLARIGPGEVSPYRGAGSTNVFPAFDRAIDLLEKAEPVAAYFVVADAADVAEHDLQCALLNAIGAACETAGERHVARAGYEAGANLLEAMRLESDIPLTRVAMDQRVHEAGIRHHCAALDADPDDVVAMEGLAMRLEAAGHHLEATEVAKRTITRYPSRLGSYLVLVDALAASDAVDAALAAVEQATASCPDDPLVWVKRGELTVLHGDHGDAIDFFRRALELDETLWDVHEHVAVLLLVRGEEQAYLEQRSRMLAFAPTPDEHDRVADLLDEARGGIEGGEVAAEAQRRIDERRAQREEDIARGLRVPDPVSAQKSGMSAGSLLAMVAIAAVVFAIWKWWG